MAHIRFGRMSRGTCGARVPLVPISILIIALAGCASTQPSVSPTSEPPIGPITRVIKATQVVRPIDSYLPDLQEVTALWRARYVAMNQCLSDHGSSARFVQDANMGAFIAAMVKQRTTMSDAYGFFDVENASQYGYHLSPADNVPVVERIPDGVSAGLAKICRAAGVAATIGLVSITDLADSKALPDGGPPLALSDSRFRAGVTAWRKCMADHGYPNSDPVSLPFDARWQGPDAKSGADIPVATTDINCKVNTNLVGIYLAVQSAYDQRYIDSHATQLVAFRAKFQAAIRGAAN